MENPQRLYSLFASSARIVFATAVFTGLSFSSLSYLGVSFAPERASARISARTAAQSSAASQRKSDFERWLSFQVSASDRLMRRNISPEGTATGVVLASPSRRDPNYYYHWVRDAALVMDAVRAAFEESPEKIKPVYFKHLDAFTRFSRRNQLTETLTGLGEPRFNVDGSADREPWGRPQNDGPALRALALTRFAVALLKDGKDDYVRTHLYRAELPASTVIKADLEYVASTWRQKCFDPWEEIRGHHFFTRAVQMAALFEGARLAKRLGDLGAETHYRDEAVSIGRELERHWNEDRGWYMATLESEAGPDHQKPSELDTSVILAALTADATRGPIWLLDDRILSTATALETTFQRLYAVNKTGSGTAIGRYEEDYYFGGNPWVLTTAAFAELHYRVSTLLRRQKSYRVTRRNHQFLASALSSEERPSLRVGMDIGNESALKALLLERLRQKGDTFLERVRLHAHSDGGLAEQIDRETGFMISAADLTWSYASVLQAARHR